MGKKQEAAVWPVAARRQRARGGRRGCKNGKEANCGIYYVYCERCNAVEASVTAAYDPSMRKRKHEVRHQHFHALIVTISDVSDEEEPLTLDYGDGYWPEQVNIMKCEKEYELLQTCETKTRPCMTKTRISATR